MARPGVTKNDVFQAAIQLAGQGKYPTIADVRQLLGTGSNSTIAGYMKEWHASQNNENTLALNENVPVELVSVLKGLWQRVREMAEEEVDVISEKHRIELHEQTEVYFALKSEHQQLQQKEESSKKENIGLSSENKALQILLQDHEQSLKSLQIKFDSLQEALQEKQTRIHELKELHQKSQDNLEHFRESVREQRLIDQTRFEEGLSQKESVINLMQQNIVNYQTKLSELKQNENQLIFENQSLKDSMQQMQKTLTDNQQALETEKNQRFLCEATLTKREEQCGLLEKKLTEKEMILLSEQKNATIYFEQLQQSKNEIIKLTEANKILAEQKWELAQEKSVLQGQLRQMNEFMNERVSS